MSRLLSCTLAVSCLGVVSALGTGTECKDTPGWKDPWDRTCAFYQSRTALCEYYADHGFQFLEGNTIAPVQDSCCACRKDLHPIQTPVTPVNNAKQDAARTDKDLVGGDFYPSRGYQRSGVQSLESRKSNGLGRVTCEICNGQGFYPSQPTADATDGSGEPWTCAMVQASVQDATDKGWCVRNQHLARQDGCCPRPLPAGPTPPKADGCRLCGGNDVPERKKNVFVSDFVPKGNWRCSGLQRMLAQPISAANTILGTKGKRDLCEIAVAASPRCCNDAHSVFRFDHSITNDETDPPLTGQVVATGRAARLTAFTAIALVPSIITAL